MLQLAPQSPTAVDVVFPIEGRYLARDHAQGLMQVLCQRLPWLATEAQAGIHPVKLVPGSDPVALLSRRSVLMLRVALERVPELGFLAGQDLMVDDQRLRLGIPHRRELQAHATMYAYKVAADSADEVVFMAQAARELAELGIGGERVCGLHHELRLTHGVMHTFSLMLHALPPDQSLRVQQIGIGPHRLLGCGIFVPHKSAAAA